MQPNIKHASVCILLCLAFVTACKPLQNGGGADWATVKFSIDETDQKMAFNSVSGSSIKTALIIAVSGNVTASGINNYLTVSYDRRLQDLTNNTVSLSIPLNARIRLVKVVFQEELTLEYILRHQPKAFCTGISNAFKVKGNDAAKSITLTMDSVLYSKEITAFGFKADKNTALSVDVEGIISGTNVNLTVPDGTNVTSLIATFDTSGHAITANGTAQVSGVTVNDFTANVTYSVFCAYGKTQNYTVAARPTTSGGCVLDSSKLDNCSLQ